MIKSTRNFGFIKRSNTISNIINKNKNLSSANNIKRSYSLNDIDRYKPSPRHAKYLEMENPVMEIYETPVEQSYITLEDFYKSMKEGEHIADSKPQSYAGDIISFKSISDFINNISKDFFNLCKIKM